VGVEKETVKPSRKSEGHEFRGASTKNTNPDKTRSMGVGHSGVPRETTEQVGNITGVKGNNTRRGTGENEKGKVRSTRVTTGRVVGKGREAYKKKTKGAKAPQKGDHITRATGPRVERHASW